MNLLVRTIALGLLLLSLKSYAQTSDHIIKRKGYLFYIGYDWYFQPLDNSVNDVVGNIGKASFPIQLLSDGVNDAVRNLDVHSDDFDSVIVRARWSQEKPYEQKVLYYSYAELEYTNTFFLPTENIHKGIVEIQLLDASNSYYLCQLFFLAEVYSAKVLPRKE